MLTPFMYAACALVWGTTWFAIRRCIGPGGYPTFASAALRFALAATAIGIVYAFGGARPGPRNLRQLGGLVLCGVLSAVSYALVYAAEERITGGLCAVLYGTFPLFMALFVTITGAERVKRRELVGSAVALAGVGVVFLDRVEVSTSQAIGVVLVLISVVVSVVYSVVMKKVATEVHPLAATGAFLGASAICLGIFAACVERQPLPWPPPVGATVALLYLAGVGSVFVFAAYFYLLKHVSMMMVSTLVLIEPIVALAVDAVGEKDVMLVPRSYAGIAVTIVGVAVSVLRRPTPAPPTPPATAPAPAEPSA